MRNIKRLLQAVVVLTLILISIAFVLENSESTSLVFFGWSTPQLPLAAYIIFVFLLGMTIGPFLFWYAGRRSH
jgi:putative membrane protein